MRAKRRWAALAVTVGLLAGSVGGGIALGADSDSAMKQSGGDAMQQSSGDAMKKGDASGAAMKSSSGDAMQQQGAAMHGAAMSAAQMTG